MMTAANDVAAVALVVIAIAQVARLVLSAMRLLEWRASEQDRKTALRDLTEGQERVLTAYASSMGHAAGVVGDATGYRQ